jgi:succinyl-CoA synthetase beta subunit
VESEKLPGLWKKGSKAGKLANFLEYGGSESPEDDLQEEFICISASTAVECLDRRASG